MRPVSVFASSPGDEVERIRADLRGRWRQAARAVMVLLFLHGLSPAQIAGLLECHPATVRRWIGRFNAEGLAGLADRPRCGRPQLGGRRLTRRIAALLARPGPWTLPRIARYLGWPQSARARCIGGCGRSRSGGGPSSLPAAIPIMTTRWPESWPGCWNCPGGRWCWPRTRPT
jgi:Homeodomain-like domain